MKTFEYLYDDHYGRPPLPWELDTGGGWELVAIVPFKQHDTKYYRAYYKREMTE